MDFTYKEGLTDIVLRVENVDLHVNKGLLMTASPVFERMFLSDFSERRTNVVEMPGKSASNVEMFLTCIHPNYIVVFTDKVVGSVLPLANEYQVEALVHRCQEFLLQKYFSNSYPYSQTPDINTLVNCLRYSTVFQLHKLWEASVKLLSRCKLSTFYNMKEYLDLPADVRELILVRRIEEMEKMCESTRESSKYNIDLRQEANRYRWPVISDLFHPEKLYDPEK